MFENCGEKIKKISIVLFWITLVASIILAFVLGWDEVYHSYHYSYGGYTEKVFRPLYFFTFFIGVPVSSYISTLFLVAFGDLVENSDYIKELNEKITMVKEAKSNDASFTTTNQTISEGIPASDVQQTSEVKGWKCQCGQTNEEFVFTCSCGRNKNDNV